VLDHGQPIALVDTQTFEVSDPSEASDASGFPWAVLVVAPIALLVAWTLSLGIRRRRHGVAAGGAR
jgi:hypothetical protein